MYGDDLIMTILTAYLERREHTILSIISEGRRITLDFRRCSMSSADLINWIRSKDTGPKPELTKES